MSKFPEPPRKIPTPPRPLKPLSEEDLENIARNVAAIGVASTIDVSKVKGVRPMTTKEKLDYQMSIVIEVSDRVRDYTICHNTENAILTQSAAILAELSEALHKLATVRQLFED